MNEKLFFDFNAYLIREINEKKIFLSNKYFNWFATTESGMRILELLNGSNCINEIAQILSKRYDIPYDIILKDIDNFCNNMKKNGLIGIQPPNCITYYQHIFFNIINNHDIMSAENFNRILLTLKDKVMPNVTSFFLFGTDPLAHPQLEELISNASKSKCKLILWSTETVSQKENIAALKGRFDEFIFSFKYKTNAFEQSPDFPILKYCYNNGFPFSAFIKPSKINIFSGNTIVDFLSKINAKKLYIENPLCSNDTYTMKDYLSFEQQLLKKEIVLRFWQNKKISTPVTSVFPMRFLCQNTPHRICAKKDCGCNHNIIAFDPTGKPYPCYMYIDSKKIVTLKHDKSDCSTCSYYFLCLGGCKALFDYNSTQSSDELCNYTKALYESLLFEI